MAWMVDGLDWMEWNGWMDEWMGGWIGWLVGWVDG